MDELLYQNATEDVAGDTANATIFASLDAKWPQQVWEKMDNSERAQLAQIRAAAPPFGRRQNGTGFGSRAGTALPMCPSQRAQIRQLQTGFGKN